MLMLRNSAKSQRRRKRRRLRRVSVLPALLTVIHLLCGFAAIHFSAKATALAVAHNAGVAVGTIAGPNQIAVAGNPAGEVRNPMLKHLAPTLLGLSCWLIFLAMIVDGLDGAAARWTRSASEFGAQLDSLADVISFGAAPAFILIALLQRYAFTDPDWSPGILSVTLAGRIAWLMAASFVACAALRLARFNVETSPDPEAHLWFRGLPSPGAAGALVSLVILHEEVLTSPAAPPWASEALIKALPLAALGLALLMVSRIRYPHLLSQYLRGRRSFGHLVKVVLIVVMLFVHLQLALVVLLCGYALWAPLGQLYRRLRPRPEPATEPEVAPQAHAGTEPPPVPRQQAHS